MKNKIFKDPVHGYIKIPAVIVDTFIDTELFQRLRRIEQTSMRCLYPAARHDRFIHSIGVYHLGRRAIDALFSNTTNEILYRVFKKYKNGEQRSFVALHDNDVREVYKHEIEKIKTSFNVACLMHDCAHSPFSHTFEEYYYTKHSKEEYITAIDGYLGTKLSEQSIKAKPHEVVSSYVLVRWLLQRYEYYKDIGLISKGKNRVVLKVDLELVVRCIMGRHYYKNDGDYRISFYNAVIDLLNSKSIDVDKLDYLIRDTFNSGVDNFIIDVDRFISSITILKHPEKIEDIVLGYKKNSLSILKSIIYARDHLFTWIYSHHKVVYHSKMLKRFLDVINKRKYWGEFIKSAFDVENFFKPKLFPVNDSIIYFYMVNDGDLCYIFKQFYKEFDEYRCIFAREHHVSMWKSYAEYYNIFGYTPLSLCEQKEVVKKQTNKFVERYGYNDNDFIVADSSFVEGYIHPNKTYIELDNETKTIADLSDDFDFPRLKKEFFYLYLPKNITKEHKNELMEKILRNI